MQCCRFTVANLHDQNLPKPGAEYAWELDRRSGPEPFKVMLLVRVRIGQGAGELNAPIHIPCLLLCGIVAVCISTTPCEENVSLTTLAYLPLGAGSRISLQMPYPSQILPVDLHLLQQGRPSSHFTLRTLQVRQAPFVLVLGFDLVSCICCWAACRGGVLMAMDSPERSKQPCSGHSHRLSRRCRNELFPRQLRP